MDDRLYNLILKLPKANIIHLMYKALDEMQCFNGRSCQTRTLEAMGAEEVQIGSCVKHRLPTLAELRRNTETMPPF